MPQPDHETQDYNNLVNLLAVHSEATNRMQELQAGLQGQYLELIDSHKGEYANLQQTLSDTEAALKELALRHPEWFPENNRSVKTPYGTAKMTASTALEIANEEATILLIEKKFGSNADAYLRRRVEVNREALEALEDAELKAIRVIRVKGDSFSVSPAKLDMGKAIKSAEKKGRKGVAA